MTAPDSAAVAVDVHAHLVPPGLLDAVRAGYFSGVAVDTTAGRPVLAAGDDLLDRHRHRRRR